MKRQDSEKTCLISDELTLEKLQSEPKINGRLRYHRNLKDKAFIMSNQKLECFQSGNINLDELCCKMEFVKA